VDPKIAEPSRPREPRLLRCGDVPLWLWGDAASHRVSDRLYATSDKIHFIMFSLRPGAYWRHSDTFKPVYGADEGYYVLQGRLTLHNPQTGEVCLVNEGEALHFRRDTWHYGYNITTRETLVLEAFAPVPADITPDELARAAPPLPEVRSGRYELLGDWPWNSEAARQVQTLRVLRPPDWLHIIAGEKTPLLVSLFVATDKLTMGCFSLLPGIETDVESHPGDEVAVVVEGRVNLHLPGANGLFDLRRHDGFFVPGGVQHQYYNPSDQPATVVFGVAPKYR
jgi:quercetin dioxygenase-like cupin family protein